MTTMQELKDQLAIDLFGATKAEATNTGLCIQCKKPAIEQCYSEAGRREFKISGMCEICFDNLFKQED